MQSSSSHLLPRSAGQEDELPPMRERGDSFSSVAMKDDKSARRAIKGTLFLGGLFATVVFIGSFSLMVMEMANNSSNDSSSSSSSKSGTSSGRFGETEAGEEGDIDNAVGGYGLVVNNEDGSEISALSDLGSSGIDSIDKWVAESLTTTLATKPNVVFILADDLGWNSMGYHDYDLDFATPFLSGLAKDGLRMENYYAQEMCTPSRASLLTGRLPITVGMQYHQLQEDIGIGLSVDETLLSEVMAKAGYKTHMYGKWDLGHYSARHLPTARGFQYFTGYLAGQNHYWSKKDPFYETFRDMISSDEQCYSPFEGDSLHDYSTFFYRDMAISTIVNHDTSTPLFLFLSFQGMQHPSSKFAQ